MTHRHNPEQQYYYSGYLTIKESAMTNETHVDAPQRGFFSFVAIFCVYGPSVVLCGAKECPQMDP